MLYVVLAAWLMATVGTALAIRYARARALLDQPGERRSHDLPTPRGGGVAIVVAVVLVGGWLLAGRWGQVGGQPGLLGTFLAALAVVAGIGWVDDHRPLPASLRLVVHLLASGVFAAVLWTVTRHPGLAALAFVAPLVLTNVWNFMDGINGIAATQAVVVAGFLSLALVGVWAMVAVAIAAACWAFVPYNFPRARVFMGDVGSGAIGFAIGGLLSIAGWRIAGAAPSASAIALLALPVSAFLLDAALTLGGRMLRRERWWAPHVQHAYQRAAVRVGHGKVTMGYLGWTLAACTLAVFARSESDFFVVSLVLGWYTLGAVLWGLLQRWARDCEAEARSGNSA